MFKSHIILTWNEYLQDVKDACEDFKSLYKRKHIKISGIYGIPRGGLIPATIFSHNLDIPIIDLEDFEFSGIQKYLILDDINCSGNTFKSFKRKHNRSRKIFYSIYRRYSSSFISHYWKEINSDAWVIFPYEKEVK